MTYLPQNLKFPHQPRSPCTVFPWAKPSKGYRFKPSQTRPIPLFLANLSLKSPLVGFSRSFKIPKGDVIKQKHYRGGRCHVPTNCGIWFHLIDLDIMLYLQTHDVHLACWFFIVFVESSLLLHVLLHFFDVIFFWFLLSTLNLITTAAHPSHGKNRTFQEAFCWEGPNNDLEINTRTMLDMQINRFVMSRKWRHCDLQS